MTIEAPLQIYRDKVRPEWIDHNGHMNVAYYVLGFDYATDAFFDYLGLGQSYLQRANGSTFAVEMNVSYVREVHEGDPLVFRTWLLGHDHKRLHYYHEMYHAGWRRSPPPTPPARPQSASGAGSQCRGDKYPTAP
jgi:acyl-CoA thioester hydrolase